MVAGCKKSSSDASGTDHTPVYLPLAITTTNQLYTDTRGFIYDTRNRLILMTHTTTDNSNNDHSVNLNYNDKDQLIEADYNDKYGNYVSTFTHYSDSIIEQTVFSGSSNLKYKHLLNSKGQITSTILGGNTTYSYNYDSSGNVIRTDAYLYDYTNKVILHNAFTATYDNSKNPFYNVKGDFILVFNNFAFYGFTANNMLTLTFGGNTPGSLYPYRFNTDGYPLNGGPILGGSITYILK